MFECCSEKEIFSYDNIHTCIRCGYIHKEILNNYNKKKKSVNKKCCSKQYLVENYKEGILVCSSCGIIAKNQRLSDSNEEYTFGSDGKDKGRTGYRDSSNPFSTLGSYIPTFYVEGRNAEGKKIRYNLANLHIRISSDNKEKAFSDVIKTFDKLVYRSFINQQTSDKAKTYWKEIVKTGEIIRGAIRKGILACCVLYSTYQTGCSRSREQIAKYMGYKVSDITSGESVFKNMISKTKYGYIITQGVNVEHMFSAPISKLELDDYSLIKRAIEIYRKHYEILSERSSKAAVGGVIYYLLYHVLKLKKPPTKAKILKAVDIKSYTLKTVVNDIIEDAESDE